MAEDFDVEAMLEAAVDNGKRDSYDGPLYRGSGGDGSPRNGDHKDSHERHSKHVRRERSKSRERKRERSRDRDRDSKKERSSRRSNSRDRYRRSRSRDRKRSRRSSRSRSPSRSSRHHSKSSSSRHYRSERHRSRSRSRDRRRESSRERRYHRSITPTKEELPLEERDQRTVFCMQLAARVCQRDIEEFFSKVGKVREVRLIMDNRTRRHKGIAYVEFVDIDSVDKAITLTGTRLCGTPIIVQHSQAEKNRLASVANSGAAPNKPAIPPHIKTKPKPNALNPMIKPSHHHSIKNPVSGPMGLYVGSLHFNVSEDMLRGIFEPFGKVEKIELARDSETQRSKGYGFVHFSQAEDAKKALEQLNGFELAGRPMKVNYVTERSKDHSHNGPAQLDSDELDRTGIDLGATGRLQLMAKLAEGTGIELPKAAAAALQLRTNNHHNIIANNNNLTSSTTVQNGNVATNQLPIATQCFLLSNMFDPRTETNPNWPEEIKNDVIEECRKHGGIVHIYVDPTSNEGHVYVKCASIMSASASVTALHGRWFAGRLITAAFVPVIHYNNLFPESANSTTHL